MSYESGLSLEERVTSLFQPDTLLPTQYFETFRRKSHLEPEKKLMLAVLEDAIACFQKFVFVRDGKGKVMFQEAEEWIQEESDDWLFSFANICEVLGFDPDYIRQGLLQWKEKQLADSPRARVYQLTPRTEKNGEKVAVPGRGGHKLIKVGGR